VCGFGGDVRSGGEGYSKPIPEMTSPLGKFSTLTQSRVTVKGDGLGGGGWSKFTVWVALKGPLTVWPAKASTNIVNSPEISKLKGTLKTIGPFMVIGLI